MKNIFAYFFLFLIGWFNGAYTEKNNANLSQSGAFCYPDDEFCSSCLGPDHFAINSAVRPLTCNGDTVILVAGFYWNAHQDGLEYAIENQVPLPSSHSFPQIQNLNNLIDSKYQSPNFKWDFGFKASLAYNSPCDGWDFDVIWTWYRGKASSHIEAQVGDNNSLIPLWSAFPAFIGSLFASDIETHWKLQLNLIDLELGRESWASRYLTLRPFLGLRIAFIKQNYIIKHKGGAWSLQPQPLNNEVNLDNNFKGVGVRSGLDSVWNFGRGFAFYGNLAFSILYGKFHVHQDEKNQRTTFPYVKNVVLETEDSFRASRGILDFFIGIQWSTIFCQCHYALTAMLGWENHLFFNQNQLWTVNRYGEIPELPMPGQDFLGVNSYSQNRGDLSTQGWTLTLRFEF